MRSLVVWLIGCSIGLAAFPADAAEVAPRITDREIVERLTAFEAGQKKLEARVDALERNLTARIDSVERSLNARIDDLRADMMARFDLLTWLISLFVTIAMVTLGFVLRMQWQLAKRHTLTRSTLCLAW